MFTTRTGIKYTEKPESRRFQGESLTLTLLCPKNQGRQLLLSWTDAHWISPVGDPQAAGYYLQSSSTVQPAECYDTVTLELNINRPVDQLTLVYSKSSGTLYGCDASTMAEPLENAPNFRTCWKYNLYQQVDQSNPGTTVPAWWGTATTLVTGDANYAWGQSTPGAAWPGYIWLLIKEATKPQVNAYLVPSATVTETRIYSSYQDAVNAVKAVGKKATPGKTFDNEGEWLILRSPVQQVENGWQVTVTYQNATKWDDDLYQ